MVNFKPLLNKEIKTFGNSMAPLLFNGDSIYIEKKPFSKIGVNDLVTFIKNNNLVTHRVIYKHPEKKFLILKGDHNLKTDGRIYDKDIVGSVHKANRKGKIIDFRSFYLFYSTFYLKEIIRITNLFRKGGLNFLILKGLPLHLYYEKSHPKRFFADCDILIDKKNFSKFDSLLRGDNYKSADTSLTKMHKAVKNGETEMSYIKIVNGFKITLDIHFNPVFLMTQIGNLDRLFPSKTVDQMANDFLDRKRNIILGNHSFPILSPTDLILYLSLHIFHHSYTGYHSYQFLHNIIKKNKIDFADLKAKIYHYNVENFAYPVFYFLNKYYKSGIPLSKIFNKSRGISLKKYYLTKVFPIDIFGEDSRINSGVKRFQLIFQLSPKPFLEKILVFVNSEVVVLVLYVFRRKIHIGWNYLMAQRHPNLTSPTRKS